MSSPIVAVFVSSTWLDLQPERSAVEKAIQRLHETKFIGMEYFGSRDETTRRASLDEVDRSQVYVGIIGGRFGSGITADEYFRARERGLPCFIYCKNPAAIPPLWCEQEAEPKAKLAGWLAELRRNHIVTEFNTPDELAAKVTADLHRWLFEVWLKPQLQQAVWQPGPQPGVQQLLEQIKDKAELPPELLAQLQQRGYQIVSGQGNIAVGDDVENSVLVSGSGNVINIYQPPANSDAPHFQPAPPTPKFETRDRRIDAAVPSQVKVGAPTDLLLQVRFPDSKLLGLEEWPFKRKPASLEQASEAVELEFPVDAATGEVGEARLYIRLVTPDFQIEGAAEKLLEVPPDEFSKIVKFLLVAKRAGYCRINVEIYDVGQVYLGAVPIEAEVGTELVVTPAPAAAYNVANFYFGVAVQGAPKPSAIRPAFATAPELESYSEPVPPPDVPAAPSPTPSPAPSPTGNLRPFVMPAPTSNPAPVRKASAWPMLMKVAAVIFVSFGAFIVFRIASPVLTTTPPVIGDPTPHASGTLATNGNPPLETPVASPTGIFLRLNGIRGRVANSAGEALSGVVVQVKGQPNWKAETDERGEFFVRCGDTQGTVTLVAEKTGYQRWQAQVTFEQGWPTQNIVLQPAREIRRPLDPKRVAPIFKPRPQP